MKATTLVCALLLLLTSFGIAGADPINNPHAYTIPSACGGGTFEVLIVNDQANVSFPQGVDAGLGHTRGIYMWDGADWIPLWVHPGQGYDTRWCEFQEGGMLLAVEVQVSPPKG